MHNQCKKLQIKKIVSTSKNEWILPDWTYPDSSKAGFSESSQLHKKDVQR